MKRTGLFIAITLLLAVNAFVLGGVVYNRQGEPDASVLLTERELPLAHSSRSRESTGLALRLSWQHYDQADDWFDAAKLAELGLDAPHQFPGRSWYRSLPAKAYVVLEFEGEAWQNYRARKQAEIAALSEQVALGKLEPEAAERRRKNLKATLHVTSRLFAVDVGRDPQQLRDQYPDRARFLILPAKVRAVASWTKAAKNQQQTRKLIGQIDTILTDAIYVSRRYHTFFDKLSNSERIYSGRYPYTTKSDQRPHYQVRLNTGRRYEPWLAAISPIETAGKSAVIPK